VERGGLCRPGRLDRPDDPAWAKFEADLRARSSAIAAESLFFSLELNQLEDGEMEAALKARPPPVRWTPWLRRLRLSRPHELTPDLERYIVDRGPAVATGCGSMTRPWPS
jgi:oligoendopeptidase F